jgi:hypothetical protein
MDMECNCRWLPLRDEPLLQTRLLEFAFALKHLGTNKICTDGRSHCESI